MNILVNDEVIECAPNSVTFEVGPESIADLPQLCIPISDEVRQDIKNATDAGKHIRISIDFD